MKLLYSSVSNYSFNSLYIVIELLIRLILPLVRYALKIRIPYIRPVYGTHWYEHFYPYQPEEQYSIQRFTIIGCTIIVAVPLLIYSTCYFWKKMPKNLIIEDCLNFFLGLSLSGLITDIMVNGIKNTFGRLRPDFLSRCLGEATRSQWIPVEELPAVPVCKNQSLSQSDFLEGRRSFPSGHSALAMSIYLYIALFVYKKFSQIKNSGSLRLAIPSSFVVFGFIIMASRISDNRHFLTDVICGGVIGTVCTLVVFAFYNEINKNVYKKYRNAHKISEDEVKDPFFFDTPAQYVRLERCLSGQSLLQTATNV